MKNIKYILLALICTLFAACMGNDYDEPALNESPYGNNELTETNVITIAELKQKFANVISSSSMVEVTEDIKIKGVVTGNDVGGNIYNEIALQDETGALIVCINQGGLYGYLPVGQEVLIALKGLIIGGYGEQLEVGGIYTNSKTGAQSIGRMSRYIWNKAYKLIGTPDPSRVEPEEFDLNKIGDENYMKENCGKLMTLRNVFLKDANGKRVYAPDDGSVALTANCANRSFAGISSSSLVLRTSTYAKFANAIMPQEKIDVTGIFTRYRDTWQILLRTEDDVQPAIPEPTAIYQESFAESQGDFKIMEAIELPEGIDFVWKWDSKYGMKASAYVSQVYYKVDSWLISPAISLAGVKDATLSFEQALRYGSDNDMHVMVSTTYKEGDAIDLSQWKELTLDQWPDRSNWNFMLSKASLKDYAGQSDVRIAFRYTSNTSAAATWEIKNFSVD